MVLWVKSSHSKAISYILHLFLLISGIHPKYKFIIFDIKNKQIDFLVILKFRPSPMTLINFFFKYIMLAKYKNYFLTFLVC